MTKTWKTFYQHDLDRLTLCEKFSKSIFEKAWKVELSSEPILPHMTDNNAHQVRTKLKLYHYIPLYNPAIVNRQWWPRFSIPLSGSLNITQEQANDKTLLLFNSRFESGNLERAYKIEEMYKVPQLTIRKSGLAKNQNNQSTHDAQNNKILKPPTEARYDLFLTPDWGIGKKPNKEGEYVRFGMTKHTQWFYFSTK